MSYNGVTSDSNIFLREPVVSGSFYPSNKEKLREDIEKFLEIDKPNFFSKGEKIIGIVSPHAGYVYSGFVAGKVYRELRNGSYSTVIIISPSHRAYFPFASVFPGDAYLTPLGPAFVDKQLAKLISSELPLVKFGLEGHSGHKGDAEHSLEVQIPFVQTIFPDSKIVPIVMGSQEQNVIHQLSMAIYNAIKKSETSNNILLIASSDLSHYHSYKTAYAIDEEFLSTFSMFDYFKLINELQNREVEACGAGPIAVVMAVSESFGANRAINLYYATSGDSPFARSEHQSVVGYFSGALISDPNYSRTEIPSLPDEEKKKLLEIVKQTVEATANRTEIKPIEIKDSSPLLTLSLTGFVTINKNDELRACMGHIVPTKPLILEIQDVARLSATGDWRFGPIHPNELPYLTYEITIISRFKKVFDFKQINVGKNGLYIRYKNHTGLLLPQVASTRNWNLTTFLENLCLKAGLAKNTYLDPEAEIYSFEALIIKS
ncbi:MAG: AmmeMemoRadiSam system protein B [Ignavibacteria bacterium]|nr:AmmeMemoRadiSam system protein B [Ignavibacteria bacterium]